MDGEPPEVASDPLSAGLLRDHERRAGPAEEVGHKVALVGGGLDDSAEQRLWLLSRVRGRYADARQRGYEMLHRLTQEPWGTRRFLVRDPNGIVVNVVGHPD